MKKKDDSFMIKKDCKRHVIHLKSGEKIILTPSTFSIGSFRKHKCLDKNLLLIVLNDETVYEVYINSIAYHEEL